MARAYTDEERQEVRARIVDVATRRFAEQGIRKTTIDEIVGEVGIAKGTFYLFFKSKEECAFDILEETEHAFREEHLPGLLAATDSPRDRLKALMMFFFVELRQHPLWRLFVDPSELGLLVGKVPPARIQEHMEADDSFLVELIATWQRRGELIDVDPETVSSLLRTLILVNLHEEMIGERFLDVVELLTDLIADGLTPRSDP